MKQAIPLDKRRYRNVARKPVRGLQSAGGASPQTAEIIKTLGQRCPEMIVTDVPGKADYALLLDHEGGKGLLRRKNKVAVFNKDGDSIFSDSTITLGGQSKGLPSH